MINKTTNMTISGVAFVRSCATLEKLASNFTANLGMCQIKKRQNGSVTHAFNVGPVEQKIMNNGE